MLTYKVVTAPATEPISTSEAKLHCRVDLADDDVPIAAWIVGAREEVERQTGMALITQTLELVLNDWPSSDRIELPRPPLTSVTSVKYKDKEGNETTWDSANYLAGVDSIPGVLALAWDATWPSIDLYPVEPIRIRYVAGFANAAAVPQSLKQAMLLLIGHWYENREAGGDTVGEKAGIAFGFDRLIGSYRAEALGR
jgi:uncharacterized phiE125 gp8 family phage protein